MGLEAPRGSGAVFARKEQASWSAGVPGGGRRAASPCAGTDTFLRETAGLGKAQRAPSGLA